MFFLSQIFCIYHGNITYTNIKMITRIIQSQEQLANNVTVEINIEEYVVWVSGGSYNEETKEESEPCDACMALNGQIFHVNDVPKAPHNNCKCGIIPASQSGIFHMLMNIEERVRQLERAVEQDEEKIKKLEEFKTSKQFKENIKEAEKMRGKLRHEKYKWMYDNFKTGGKYDIKHSDQLMEHAGNFNYGAMGMALGLTEFELKKFAGAYQIYSQTSDLSFWYSNFDDPVDQRYIQECIDSQ